MICCVSKTMCQQNNVSSKVCQLILVESSLMCPTKVTHNARRLGEELAFEKRQPTCRTKDK